MLLSTYVAGVGPHSTLPANQPISFFGPTATVTITSASQRIFATAHRYLGAGAVRASSLDLWICYQNTIGAAGPTTVGAGMFGAEVPTFTRIPFGVSAVVSSLAAGTYNIGMCGQTTSANWTNNDFGYISVIVANN